MSKRVKNKISIYDTTMSETYAISRAFDTFMIRRTFWCIDVWKNADTRLIDTNEICTTWCPIENETMLRKEFERSLDNSTCGSERAWEEILIKNWLQNLSRSSCIFYTIGIDSTYLHSKSFPRTVNVVRALNWSMPGIIGVDAPSLHWSDPHWIFLAILGN